MTTVYIDLVKCFTKTVTKEGVATQQFTSVDAILMEVHRLRTSGYQVVSAGATNMILELNPQTQFNINKQVNF